VPQPSQAAPIYHQDKPVVVEDSTPAPVVIFVISLRMPTVAEQIDQAPAWKSLCRVLESFDLCVDVTAWTMPMIA
jgi:hypothetical protein